MKKPAAMRAFLCLAHGFICRSGRPVFDAALSRSKQAAEYLQHPPIGSLSYGRGLG